MARINTREDLIATMRGRLVEHEWPRLVAMLIVSLSGGAAFGASVLALNFGVDEMAVRYPLATLVGYATFMLLIRVWIAVHRTETDSFPDVLHHIDPGVPMFDAGSSSRGALLEPGWFDSGFDVDELWFVFLAIACALGGLMAVAYVVYIAPVLLAEVALDAALLSTVYRRLRREDASWWAASVFRRTWVPAVILTIFMGATGWALQQIAPDARSIGGVVRELLP